MKITKKVLKYLSYFFAFFIVLIVVSSIALSYIVTKDLVAEQIEGQINGRVEIRDISVPIWAALSGITVEGFKIAPKDEEMKKPMPGRSPLENETIGFESFNFKIALGSFITSFGEDLKITEILISEPKAHIVLYKNGGNNLTPLLLKPREPGDTTETDKPEKEPAEKPVETAAGESEPFSIKSIPTVIELDKVGIEDGLFTVNVKQLGNTLQLSNVDFLFTDIVIDPKNLDKKDRNHIGLESRLTAELKESQGRAVQSFKIIFSTYGNITPFNAETGQPTEQLSLRTTLHKDTFFTGLAVYERFKDKAAQLKKAGVNVDFLQKELRLVDDATMALNYAGGVITAIDRPHLPTADFDLKLDKNSWLNVKSLKHEMTGLTLLSEKHSNRIKSEVEKALAEAATEVVKALPSELRSQAEKNLKADDLRKRLLAKAVDSETGRLGIWFASSGYLASPAVRMTKPQLPSLQQMVKDAFGNLKGDVKAALKGKLNEAKAKAQQEINKKKSEAEAAAKAKAEEEKRKVAEEAKKKLNDKLPF